MTTKVEWADATFNPVVGCMFRCGKRRAGCLLDGREWNEVPEVKA
ncbi:phage Gp37/Gp68 family protein [Desulfovibrio fairfieldensis]|nr:phage Gp37/Gp68 family protein [Desulfovibrio fairfieldensis]